MLLAYGVTICESAEMFVFEEELEGIAPPVNAAKTTAER
jgi:hypothetical protein